jgi:hypothetical protein
MCSNSLANLEQFQVCWKLYGTYCVPSDRSPVNIKEPESNNNNLQELQYWAVLLKYVYMIQLLLNIGPKIQALCPKTHMHFCTQLAKHV